MDEIPEGCPACRCTDLYRLGDGRNKCRRCGKRYTRRKKSGRLSPPILRRLALCFWQMVPTREAAGLLMVNRKTVQRHYRLLRARLIAEEEDCLKGKPGPEKRSPEMPLAAVSVCDLRVKVNFPTVEAGRAPGTALIYRRRNRADPVAGMSDLQLWIPAGCGRAETEAVLKFWGFAGRLAGMYRGRCWKDLPLFLQEVAYRCNRRDDPEVIGDLTRLLVAGEGGE